MIKNFIEYNEKIGFRIGNDDLPGEETHPSKKRKTIGFKHPSFQEIENVEKFDDFPENLKDRKAFTSMDLINLLTWLKDKTNSETNEIIDYAAEEIGLTSIGKVEVKPIWNTGRFRNKQKEEDEHGVTKF